MKPPRTFCWAVRQAWVGGGLLVGSLGASSAFALTPGEVIEKSLTALGGRETFLQITAATEQGSFTGMGNMTFTYTWRLTPAGHRLDFESPFGKGTKTYRADGSRHWYRDENGWVGTDYHLRHGGDYGFPFFTYAIGLANGAITPTGVTSQGTMHAVTLTAAAWRATKVLWIQEGTWRWNRLEEMDGKVSTAFKEWRNMGDFQYPIGREDWHAPVRDRWTVTDLEWNQPVAAEAFARPPAPPPDFTGVLPITLAMDRENGNWLVKASYDATNAGWVFPDTGASFFFPVGEALPDAVRPKVFGGRADPSGPGGSVLIPTLALNGLTLVGWKTYPMSLATPGTSHFGRKVLGPLGADLFKRFLIKINGPRREFSLHDRMIPPEGVEWRPLLFMKYRPYLPGTLNGHPALFGIDTGAADLGVLTTFASRWRLKEDTDQPFLRHAFFGVDQGVDELGLGREAVIGPVTIRQPILSLTKQLGGAMDLAEASLGASEIGSLVTWWDYEGGRIGFDRSAPLILTASPTTYRLECVNDLGRSGNTEEALRLLRQWRQEDPREFEYLKGEISFLTRTNRLDEAARLLRQRMQEDPTAAGPALLAGMTALRLKRYEEAIHLLKRAVTLGWPQDDRRVAQGLLAACEGSGRFDEGLAVAREAAATYPWDREFRSAVEAFLARTKGGGPPPAPRPR